MALGLTPQQIIDQDNHPQLRISDRWNRVLLNDVADVQNGYAFKSKFFSREEGVPLIRIRDINSKETDNLYTGEFSEDFIVTKGDILIGMDGDFNVSKWPGERGLLNQRVCRIIPKSADYSAEFLFHVLQPYLNAIHAETSAVTVKHLSSKTIRNLPIPNPPLPEQRAIVEKLELLLGELDQSVLELEGALGRLGVYRQSTLNQAFAGSYEEKPLSEVADTCLGKMLDKRKNEGEYEPYLGNINVRWGKFDLTNLKEMRILPNMYERYGLRKGDLVMCEGGEPGRCAIWKSSEEVYIQKALHRIRPSERVDVSFLYYWFVLLGSTNRLAKYFTGTTIKHLTGRKLKQVQIPIPSLPEQHQIVSEIESRLSVADALEREILGALERVKGVRMGVLKKAFAGELVTNHIQDSVKQQAKVIHISEASKQKRNIKFSKPVQQAAIIAMTVDRQRSTDLYHLAGHVKCEKVVHLADYIFDLNLDRRPRRFQAGPLDKKRWKEVEKLAKSNGYFKAIKNANEPGYRYKLGKNSNFLIEQFVEQLDPETHDALNKLIDDFLHFDKETAEIPATIYAAWNNLILEGKSPTDEEIIYAAREGWHKAKLRIPRERFPRCLDWMRENGYVAVGKGAYVEEK